ncbi:MAG: PqqD family peptide modification chaperone [Phycisphaeraceae bacterium]|nr:PqqD family peptide modification chaperone [Phycisphaeraceae bacterium]
MNDRPTFSPFWHRVRLMKPRLRPHVQITRQQYRGRRWHVVHDPTSNQFYRLNPIAQDFVGMLDGTRGVEEAWRASLQKFGDMAPTQNEVIQLISQLYSANLLACDTTPETDQLLRRGRERIKKKVAAQAIGIMYFKIRMFNPDRLLTLAEPIIRPILNIWGFLAWCVLLVAALVTVLPEWDRLAQGFDDLRGDPSQWIWVGIVFVITKAIHEFGHGVLCKRFGGQVPEFGIMLLVLFPSPYVDASACWAFPSKWKRVAVGAGGMIFELAVASVAAFVWVSGQPGDLATKLAYNAMLTASISTVLFNANPLMRFDGYYILADWLEVPNLAQRSNKMLMHLMQKYVYRLRNLTAPSSLRGEQAILITYGLAALAYRIFLFITITLYVMGKFFAIGLLLAVWTASAWFIIPIGKFLHWHASSPQHSEHRLRGWGISCAMIALVVIALGMVPFPDRRRGEGIVESLDRTTVYFLSEGFIDIVHKRAGDHVEAGEAIVTFINPELEKRADAVLAQLEEFQVQERSARAAGEIGGVQIALERIRVAQENLDEVRRMQDDLVVRAPHAGVIAGMDLESRRGGFLKRADPVCEVVDPSRLRVVAVMEQRQAAWLFEGRETVGLPVSVRFYSSPSTLIEGIGIPSVEAGQKIMPSAALTFVGGGRAEPEMRDESGRVTKRPWFPVRIEAENPADLIAAAFPGERVKVRFDLPPRPLAAQWLDRLQKEMQGRVQL